MLWTGARADSVLDGKDRGKAATAPPVPASPTRRLARREIRALSASAIDGGMCHQWRSGITRA